VIGRNEDWLMVVLADGEKAWVFGDLVREL
jgi:hypothetical protein